LFGSLCHQSRKSEKRLKRGGGVDHFALDFNEAENELFLETLVSEITPEEYFHQRVGA